MSPGDAPAAALHRTDPRDARRAALVAAARAWIGTPYVHGASVRGVGCDCLGLVRGVWRAVIGPEPVAVPPYAPDWGEGAARSSLENAARRWLVPLSSVAEARPGDVLLFRWRSHDAIRHAAIVGEAGPGGPRTILHAHDGASVCEAPLAGPWARRVAGAWAFPVPEELS